MWLHILVNLIRKLNFNLKRIIFAFDTLNIFFNCLRIQSYTFYRLFLQDNRHFIRFQLQYKILTIIDIYKQTFIQFTTMNSDDQSWLTYAQKQQITLEFNEDQIQRIIYNLIQSGIDVAEFELAYTNVHERDKFLQIKQQQQNEERIKDLEQDEEYKQQNKFQKSNTLHKDPKYDSKQLSFKTYQFLKIFVKIYQKRLNQMETQYHYKITTFKTNLKVFYPKNQKLSSFFKNQIFQMKNKLQLYYCYDQRVVQKIQFSKYFHQLIQKQGIAAQYNKYRRNSPFVIFFSKEFSRREMQSFVKKNLLQHISIIQLNDKFLHRKTNNALFASISSFLSPNISQLTKKQSVMIQLNKQKCRILIYDRHECFTSIKLQIQQALANFISFRLHDKSNGNKNRTIYNKIIRNQSQYPYLRAKYTQRSLVCVLDCKTFQMNKSKNLASLKQIFKPYFQEVSQQGLITFFLKNLKYPDIVARAQNLTQNKNIMIKNYQLLTRQYKNTSKLVLSIKQFNQYTEQQTKKDFFQIFLSILLKANIKQPFFNPKKNENYFPKTIQKRKKRPNKQIKNNNSQSIIEANDSKNQLNQSYSKISQLQTSISQNSSQNIQKQPQTIKLATNQKSYDESGQFSLNKILSYERSNSKKSSKKICIQYSYKGPLVENKQQGFYQCEKRESKLEKALVNNYKEKFQKLGFKIYRISLKIQIQTPKIQQVQEDSIYLSTTIQKSGQLSHHFIDLNQFQKMNSQKKEKTYFIFYKLKDSDKYVPSYALKLIA